MQVVGQGNCSSHDISSMRKLYRLAIKKLTAARKASIEKQEKIRAVSAWKQKFGHIMLLDTSVGSDNVGDEIIVESIRTHVLHRFPNCYITTCASHDGLGRSSRELARSADLILLMGTNALSQNYHVDSDFIWSIASEDLDVLANKVLLVGVGANRSFSKLDPRQRRLLQSLLCSEYTHSVRDSSGLQIVELAGRKAVNTSCPTLWKFSDEVKLLFPPKSDCVCFTLTKHKPSRLDSIFIQILRSRYQRLVFWPQQPRDLAYLEQLTDISKIYILPPTLKSYDDFLSSTSTDVIGTRLHGTIRGMQHGRRSIVISIDNRAREISALTGLPAIERESIEEDLSPMIDSELTPRIRIPQNDINIFLNQFDTVNL
jgi:polysaccharide pyruvyl transferase WcaK-like protein